MKTNITLKIKKVGPIRDAEIKFAPFMIFTGNSNLGKSYVNYLVYYFISFFTEGEFGKFIKDIRNDKNIFSFEFKDVLSRINNHVEQFMRDFLGDPYLECDVEYLLDMDSSDCLFNVSFEKISLPKISLKGVEGMDSEDIKAYKIIINDKEDIVPYFYRDINTLVTRYICRYLQHKIFGKIISKSIIMPPARGSLVGENFSFKEQISSTAGMYKKFLNDYDWGLIDSTIINSKKAVTNKAINNIIGGNIITDKGIQYLLLDTKKKIPLVAAASSVKELSPLLFCLKNRNASDVSFCIEEPEAHLHPQMQIKIADLLAECINSGTYIQITTHSDYFLQRVNQLIKFGYVKKMNNKLFDDICKENKYSNKAYLNMGDVKSYFFHLDSNNNVIIDSLPINEKGMPFSTFFDVVKKMTDDDDMLNDILEDL